MKKTISVCFSALLLLVSCNKAQEQSAKETFLGVNCPQTRVMLDSDLHTVWNKDDQISVFYRGDQTNAQAIFQGADGASSGTVRFSSSSSIVLSELPTYAVSPYNSAATLVLDGDGDVIRTSIPSVQQYRSGSFGLNSALLVSSSMTNDLSFVYASSVVCLGFKNKSFKAVDVKQITLSSLGGELLSGDVSINMADSSSPEVTVLDGTGSIVMKNADNSSLASVPAGETVKFYFCTAPSTLSKGYTFSVEVDGNPTPLVVKSTSTDVLAAGHLYSVTGSYLEEKTIEFDFVKSHWISCPEDWFTGALTNNQNGYTLTFSGVTDSSVPSYNKSKFKFLTAYDLPSLRFNDNTTIPSWIKIPCPTGGVITALSVRNNNRKGEEFTPVMFYVYSSISNPATGEVSSSDLIVSASVAGEGSLFFPTVQDGDIYLYNSNNNAQITSLVVYYSEKN